MYKVNILCVGSLKEKFYLQAQEEYLKRLNKFCEIKVIELSESKLSNNPKPLEIEKALDKEYEILLPHLKGKIIICAVEGNVLSSEELSSKIYKFFDENDTITFVIGSSYGLSSKIKQNNYLLSFSKMTLPHHLMRIVLEEQIYRAFTIKNNITYHK